MKNIALKENLHIKAFGKMPTRSPAAGKISSGADPGVVRVGQSNPKIRMKNV